MLRAALCRVLLSGVLLSEAVHWGIGFKKDSFKFALTTPGDFKTPIGGGNFMSKQPTTPAGE